MKRTKSNVPNGVYPKRIYEGKLITGIKGVNSGDETVVTLNGAPLPQRQDLEHYSEGVAWGYGGAGPTQLAFALTVDALGEVVARAWFTVVLEKIVERLPQKKPWLLTESHIWHCVAYYQDEDGHFPAKAFVEEHCVLPE